MRLVFCFDQVVNKGRDELSFTGPRWPLKQGERAIIDQFVKRLSLLFIQTDLVSVLIFTVVSGKIGIAESDTIILSRLFCRMDRTSQLSQAAHFLDLGRRSSARLRF